MAVFGLQSHSYDAVLFVSDGVVVKEMLYGEFEAVLDGVVGEPEFSNQTCEAVYVKLDTQLVINAAVFFTIKFGRDGQADPYWNLPLTQLAETADIAMEVAGNGVRIVCSSQCQTPWHHTFLWEPDLSSTSGLFKSLQAAINTNKLGFIIENKEPELSTSSSDDYAQAAQDIQAAAQVAVSDSKKVHEEMLRLAESLGDGNDERAKFANALKKLRLQMANLKQRHQQEMEGERIKRAQEKETLARELLDSSTELDKAHRKIALMATSVSSLQSQLAEQKEAFEKTLQEQPDTKEESYNAIRQAVIHELGKQYEDQMRELSDTLEMKSLELHYREQKIAELESELENSRTLESSVLTDNQQLLHALSDNDVHFVVSLPAIGPMNIPIEQLKEYLADTNRYLAQRLGVDLEIFKKWRDYAEHPVCGAISASGTTCGQQVNVVLPQEFIPGVSDCCELHRMDAQPRVVGA